MATSVPLSGSYDYRLVILSVFIAVLASYAALDLSGRLAAARGRARLIWLCGGAIAMGVGIWAMHYIGMEAFHLPVEVKYDWPTVLLSLFAAILASGVALFTVGRPTMGSQRLIVGGIFMGSGIAAMHYIGMEAMRLPAMCMYSPWLVGLSIVLAIAISFVALQLTFALREQPAPWSLRKVGGALIMGLAIPVMHYVGMAAVRYESAPSIDRSLAHTVSISSLGLAGITVVTLMLLFAVFISSAVGRHMSRNLRSLAENRLQLQAIFDTMTEAIVVVDCERDYVEHNRAACELFGLRSPTISMQQLADNFEGFSTTGAPLRHEEWPLVRAIHGDFCRDTEVIIRRKDTGNQVTVEISTVPVATQDGSKKIVISFRDITERKRAATALKESELLYHGLFTSMDEGFCIIEMIFDPEDKPIDYRFIEVNPVFEKQTGLHEAIGKRMREFAPSHESYWFELYGRVALTGEPAHLVNEAKAINGFYEVHAYRIGKPELRRVAVVFSEISERVQSEAALREQAALLDLARDAIMVRGLDGTIRFWNQGAEEIYGYSKQQAIGRVSHELLSTVFPQPLAEIEALILVGGRWDGELTHTTQNGTRIDVASQWVLQHDRDGHASGVLEINNDISVRKRMDEARNRLAAIVESSEDAIIGKSDAGIVTSWNDGAEKLFGYTAAEMVGRSIQELLPADRKQEEEEILHRIKQGETVNHFETVRAKKDGTLVHVSLTISPIRDTNGKITGASKIARNITEKKQMERQLQQSQKMEAIGQLTGGIAHDFNNLLGIIFGNLDLLGPYVAGNEAALKRVKTIQKAAARGADLTRRLLAFCSNVELKPAPTELHQSIRNMIELARALGPDIKIATHLDTSIPLVLVDAAGLESALLNLAVNSRDAMPSGGTVTITTLLSTLEESYPPVRTGELKAGTYACISVSDTGCGMSKETLARVFEPFFTTKPRGKGTGLGLAMVYGFVKQSGGTIRIYSEPGHGTTLTFYLPLAESGAKAHRAAVPAHLPAKVAGKVLVVDDEPDLLETATTYLNEMGYTTYQAHDGASAMDVIEQNADLDLIVTDIVMPGGMNGVELAKKARERRPHIKFIYCSGFPADAITERRLPIVDGPLLNKPYHRTGFGAMVSAAMEGRLLLSEISQPSPANGKWAASGLSVGDNHQVTPRQT
jgi:PAS domain S-box-containing protein